MNKSFFIDLDCQDANQLYKCITLYPEYDWYLGFQFTGGYTEGSPPEKIGKKRIQLFNSVCPKLPIEGRHIGLYCSNTTNKRNPYEYCNEYINNHSSSSSKDIPVFIIHRAKRDKKK